MNAYQLFFKLLWSVMGMVLDGKATISWLNNCLQSIIESPSALNTQKVTMPPKTNQPTRRKKASPKSFELKEADWEKLLNFFGGFPESGHRLKLLVEYFRTKGNALIPPEELKELGFTGRVSSRQFPFYISRLLAKGKMGYRLKYAHTEGYLNKNRVQFVIVE